MITFKEEFIFKEDSSIVLYKDGISIIQILVRDFKLEMGKKKDQKKFVRIFKEFYEKFMFEFIEFSNDEFLNKFDDFFKDISTRQNKNKFIVLLESNSINKDEVFKKAYFKFKSEELIKVEIENSSDSIEARDELTDTAMELFELNTPASTSISFLSIFFSEEYRYMTDTKIKYAIKKKILVLILTIILGLIFTYLINLFL